MLEVTTVPLSSIETTEAFFRRAHLGHIDDVLGRATARPQQRRATKITALAARLLLGAIFVLAGTSGFVLFHNPPPAPPGLAAAFQDVFFRSGWVLFVDALELFAGVLLLVNRFVPLALTVLAGILYNIYAFHITMMPAGIGPAIVVTILWVLVARPLRSHFAPLVAARTNPQR